MLFSLDLFARLIWGDHYLNNENDELDRMLFKYTEEARLTIANLFLRLILFVCGTVSFLDATDTKYMFHWLAFPGQDAAEAFLQQVRNNIEIYQGEELNSINMPSQEAIYPIVLRGMMAFVSERIKFSLKTNCQLKELRFQFRDLIDIDKWITE